ncbi:MAG TPA: hypothetical protein VN887_19555 [Candidatus Angelobacter sp.]|nr:hypothetical protein [Candidatus Angelobacter sp.]
MNHHSGPHSASSQFVLATVLALLFAGTGCGSKDAQNATPPSSATATSQSAAATPGGKAAIVSAEKTSFDQVTSQLDPGGSIYAYLSMSQWLEGLSEHINGWRGPVLSLPNFGSDEKAHVNKAFDLVTRLVKNSGIESVSGVGISGIALEKGFYQTKFFVGRDPNSAPGGIWTVFGRSPRPLHELDWLPADTVWAGFADVDIGAIWNGLLKQADEAGFAEIKTGLDQLNGVVQAATGRTIDELLGSLGGQSGAFLTLKEANRINIPLPGGHELEIPEPGLVIAIKVRDDALFDWVDRTLKENPQVIRSDEGGVRMRTMPIPLPLPMTVRPTIARQGDYLFIASNDKLISNMMSTKAGKQKGLKSSAEFKHLAAGMPLEGNSFGFVSQRLADTLQKIQTSVLSQAGGTANEMPQVLMQKIYSVNRPVSSFVVGRNTPQGWLTVGHGTQQPANAVVLPLVVAPVAIMAGLTLPALAKAKSKAQSISCVNNLKQMGLAARIYASDHNDAYPPDILSMKNELLTPKILVCPNDPNHAVVAALTWDNFDPSQSSYEYVTRGLTETTPGFEKKVLFRCRIHGHVCMGDGSVMQKNSGAGRN